MREETITGKNPIVYMDYPDPDVIRVGDTYYMISTTMHFLPGGEILRSYDLIHWEIVSHVYDALEDTPGQCLEDAVGIYGKGMWAASLRWHEDMFYVCFVANDTGKTYLYTAKNMEGPWKKGEIAGFYHDASLLFDEGRAYLVYGNREIWLTELNETLTAPKENGLHRLLLEDLGDVRLGYEGSHLYRIGDYYYLFLIHWYRDGAQPGGRAQGIRTEACFYSNSLTGDFVGGDVLADDLGFCNQGIAQGGIVDTPEGDWYAMLFQDRGAVGRIPVLVPITLVPGEMPRFGVEGKAPLQVTSHATKAGHAYEPLWGTALMQKGKLAPYWQWNHIPKLSNVHWTEKTLQVETSGITSDPTRSRNMLTQRLVGPVSEVTLKIDGEKLAEGDYCGVIALQYEYVLAALTKTSEGYDLVLWERYFSEYSEENVISQEKCPDGRYLCLRETVRLPWNSRVVLRMQADFTNMKDEVSFSVLQDGVAIPFGKPHKLHFCLEHFVGARLGLSVFSTKHSGGIGCWEILQYDVPVL